MLEFFVLPCGPETAPRRRGYSVRAGCYWNRDTSRNGDSRFAFEERKLFAVAAVAVRQISGRPLNGPERHVAARRQGNDRQDHRPRQTSRDGGAKGNEVAQASRRSARAARRIARPDRKSVV